ncbi:neurogenic locus notch homolog protein 4 [Candoia aspera]|uniref:neurogenic locus notch homolog protein 4 n=1 Tax=Candoia aspera TaxID=51853 RepID=UPI002FD83347
MKPLLLLMLIPFAGAESCPQMPCKNGGTCLNHSNGTSSCLCPPGYVGDMCQFADPCTPVLCQNGGTCSSRALPPPAAPEYVCVCPSGFTGEKCQEVVGDPCFPSPCQHGGMCQRVPGNDHQCQCLSGWTGKNCQLMDFCPANPCANGGTCVITYPVIVCQCWPGFEGHTCQHDINECFGSPGPCLNGGSCINNIGSFRCLCPPDFTGPLCQYQLGPCSLEICLHGGTCHHIDERYYGCLCLPGNCYTGQYCEVNPDDCAGHQCLNGGTCQDGIGSYACHCRQGWTGLLCHLHDACLSNPCHPDAHCDTDLLTGHAICTCQLGYAGALCDEDIDECRMGSNPCEHGGSCYNMPGSFTCSCLRGYTGSRCESNLNECLSQPCQNGASCLDLLDCFQCLCPSGFGGPFCEVEECMQDHCLNGGTCVLQSHGTTCLCPPGFEGPQCETDADFCRGAPCEHGTCMNAPGSFTCVCAPGFTGPLCKEFSDPCWKFQCLNGGSCHGTESGPLCICSPGWTGQNCDTEMDACNSSPCHQRATCLSRQGAFHCICPSGYVGATCHADVDECSLSPCLHSGTCLNSPGSFHCLCSRSYTGPRCQVTLDLCSAHPCRNGGQCIVKESAPRCLCPPGWGGPQCQQRANPNRDNCTGQTGEGGCQEKRPIRKISLTVEPSTKGNSGLPFAGRVHAGADQPSCPPTENCLNGGTCTKTADGFQCLCPAGTKGPNCDLDPCSLPGPHCYYGGTCMAQPEGFSCICPPGYVGERCEGVVDACFSQPCHQPGSQSCQSHEHGFQCLCHPGYSGLLCESVIDSCQSNPCLNGGSCSMVFRHPLEFICHCPQGYEGPTCDLPAPPCGSLYCHNGGTCIARPSGPQCLCKEGFSGPDCHQPPCSPASCPAANATMPSRCPTLAGDAHCDRVCSSPETSWDGGDCALGLLDPWEKCPKRDLCQGVFRDGHCQPPCDNEDCLYDGFDCVPLKECNLPYAQYCRDHFADGHCDRGCHSASCGWDGGDCASSVPPAESALALVVLLSRESLPELLRSLVVATRAALRVQRDRQDQERIYPYTGKEELGSQSNWTGVRTKDLAETIGYTIFLVVDGNSCSGQCPTSAKSALNLLGSLMAKGILSSLVPHQVVAAWLEAIENDLQASVSPFSWPLIYCVGAGALVVALVIFIGLWRARRSQHREHGSLWLPPGFAPHQGKKRRCRREPVGEDAIGLKPTKLGAELAEDPDIFSSPHFDGPLNPKDIKEDLDSICISDQGHVRPKKQMLCNASVPVLEKDTRPKAARNQEPVCGLTPPMPLACSSGLEMESSRTDRQMENFGETPLHLAARYSRADAARRLLTAGADVNARDQWGRTPLHSAIAADALGVFQILLRQRQTDLDALADDGTTPLILATRLGVENMVEELVANHANIQAVDNRGKSALHWAAAVNNVRATLVLLRNGADKDILDNQAQTPLFLAAREGSYQAVCLLLQHGAQRNLQDHTGRLPKDVALERLHHDILSLLDRPCPSHGTGQLLPHRPRPQSSSKLHRWPHPPNHSQLTPIRENEGSFKDATPSEAAMGQAVE